MQAHAHARLETAVSGTEVSAFTVPTDEPEEAGTLGWTSTTCVTVELHAGEETGLGYTYGDSSVAMAMSAVDTAMWDLKARLLGVPLVTPLGAAHGACRCTGAAASPRARSRDSPRWRPSGTSAGSRSP